MLANQTNLIRNLKNSAVNFSMYPIKQSQVHVYLLDLEIDALLVKQPGLLLQTFPSHGWLSLFPNKIQHPSIISRQFGQKNSTANDSRKSQKSNGKVFPFLMTRTFRITWRSDQNLLFHFDIPVYCPTSLQLWQEFGKRTKKMVSKKNLSWLPSLIGKCILTSLCGWPQNTDLADCADWILYSVFLFSVLLLKK